MVKTSKVPKADSRNRNCLISRYRYSIRAHLIVVLTLSVALVYGVVTIIEIGEKLSEASSDLHDQVKLLSEVQANALSVPLLNFDQGEIERQLEVLLANRDIVEAEVLDGAGDVVAMAIERGHEHTSEANHHHDHNHRGFAQQEPSLFQLVLGKLDHELHLVETEIVNLDRDVIGTLRIAMAHEHLTKMQAGLVWSNFAQFVIIVTAMSITIGVAVTRLVRPVLQITTAMEDVAAGDLSIVIPATDRRDEIGKMASALEIFKANAAQLQVMLNKERELNGLQRQFVSMVSHEFRTPLAVIDGKAQSMLRRIDRLSPDRVLEGLTKIRHSVARLSDLMESVLNSARLEEGRIDYQPEACSLPDMLLELSNSYAEIHADRKFVLNIDELPDETIADPKLLRQVFSNLLSNACKYSASDARIWIDGSREGTGGVMISIRDEGFGIPPDELKRLFERFFRASTSTGIAGTGIGLHLVQHFVDLHSGRVEVSSTVGKGTKFSVYIPSGTPTAAAA